MTDIYRYLSTAKLEQLLAQDNDFLSGITAKLDFKLPFVSGGLAGTDVTHGIGKVKSLEKKLRNQFSIPSFDEINPGTAPVFVSFKGPAIIKIYDGTQLWVTVDHPHSPILMAGSASFALGTQTTQKASFSSSADPVGAFERAFEELNEQADGESEASYAVSYIWRDIVRDAFRSHATLPHVEGLAIYATLVLTERTNLAEVRRNEVQKIVVGTPLFVRQIDSPVTVNVDDAVEKRKRFAIQVSAVQNFKHTNRNRNEIENLVCQLHNLGYRILDGKGFGSRFYLSNYRRYNRWNRAFVLHRGSDCELAKEISTLIEQFTVDVVSIDDVVEANNIHDRELISDKADIAILICSD